MSSDNRLEKKRNVENLKNSYKYPLSSLPPLPLLTATSTQLLASATPSHHCQHTFTPHYTTPSSHHTITTPHHHHTITITTLSPHHTTTTPPHHHHTITTLSPHYTTLHYHHTTPSPSLQHNHTTPPYYQRHYQIAMTIFFSLMVGVFYWNLDLKYPEAIQNRWCCWWCCWWYCWWCFW